MPDAQTPSAPEGPRTEEEIEDLLSQPDEALVACMGRVGGDLAVLGVAGKMGVSLARAAVRASREAGVDRRVIGVARFSDPRARDLLEAVGVQTVRCDLLDPRAVDNLPEAENVVYMAGRKFGTAGREALTWAMNTVAPAYVARRYRASRIVAFSTGGVYPFVPADSRGCTEDDPPDPRGEYAQSCLGRERVFEHFSRAQGTPMCLVRLFYAVEPRYGVLHDIARWVWEGEPVPLSVPRVNAIWQADANRQALRCLEHTASPPAVLNVTGPEVLSVREVALACGRILGREVSFSGEEGERACLGDARRALGLFGPPSVDARTVLAWTARWVQRGGRSLDKPAHFETTDGRY